MKVLFIQTGDPNQGSKYLQQAEYSDYKIKLTLIISYNYACIEIQITAPSAKKS
jgi:hypothetical protein